MTITSTLSSLASRAGKQFCLLVVLLVGLLAQLQALDVVNIAPASGAASEQGPVTGRFNVTRSGSTGNLTVYFVVSGSAVAADYTSADFTPPTVSTSPVAGQVSFVQGETAKTLTFTPIDDDAIEGKENVVVSLTPDATYIVGAFSASQIDIADNDLVARIVLVDPQADEDSSLFGYVNDVEIQRRAVVQVLWQNRSVSTTGSMPNNRNVAVAFTGTAGFTGDYIVQHKIMAGSSGPSMIGHELGNPTTGLGYSVYAALVNDSDIPISGGSAPIANGASITFAGDSTPYVVGVTNTSGLTPGSIHITPALVHNLANGTTITVGGTTPPSGFTVSRPYPAGTTCVKLGDGFGGIFIGDALAFGTDPSFYVATSNLGGGTLGAGSVNFARYSGGGTGAGLNLAITAVTEAKTLFTTTVANGTAQFVVPTISDRVEFSITPVIDAVVEGQETVTVTLINDKDYANTNPTVGTIGIADANAIASIALGSNAGKPNTSGSFIVNFLNNSLPVTFPTAITVPYTIDGSSTAVPGTDYVALSGTLTIPAGQSSGIIQVNPISTPATGLTQLTVSLSLSNDYKLSGAGGATTNSSATLNITDSIGEVSVAGSATPASESPTAPIATSFTITLARASAGAVNVNYVMSGSATAGTRYQTTSGSVTIPAGLTTAVVQVTPIDNQVADGTQNVVLTLAPGQGYTITSTGATHAQVSILDDEPTIFVTPSDAAKPSTNGTFTVSYPRPAGVPPLNREVEVFFTYSGTAVSGTDYTTSNAGSVKIPANSLSAAVLITPRSTPGDESNKTVTMTITPNAGYSIGTASSTLGVNGQPNISASKPTPGSSSSSSGGGCGMGSGVAGMLGFGLLSLFMTLRKRRV